MWYRRLPSRYHLLELFAFLPKWPFENIETKIVLYQNDLPVQNVIHHLNKTIRSLDPANKAGVSRPLLFTV